MTCRHLADDEVGDPVQLLHEAQIKQRRRNEESKDKSHTQLVCVYASIPTCLVVFALFLAVSGRQDYLERSLPTSIAYKIARVAED